MGEVMRLSIRGAKKRMRKFYFLHFDFPVRYPVTGSAPVFSTGVCVGFLAGWF